ncbi:unnamed protein product [Caenorhabditis brenneri]
MDQLQPRQARQSRSATPHPREPPVESPPKKARSASRTALNRVINYIVPAKMTAMKKQAKSGNKQKQKEVNAECDRLEKEQETRHKQELEADASSSTAPPTSETTDAPPPSLAPPTSDEGPAPTSEGEGDEKEGGITSKFYKTLNISSKNAKKQAKKKEQEEKMKAAAAADKEAARRTDTEKAMEKAAIKAMLTEDRLKMIDIPADGDCMYNAIAHQLQEENIEISARKLRKACAQFMRDHKDEFAPFIADSDVGGGNDNENNWELYIQGVERCAEVGGVWGGEMELKALSMMYKKVIVVYRETGKYELGMEYLDPKDRALRIVYLRKAFHLGEHYNSTCVY